MSFEYEILPLNSNHQLLEELLNCELYDKSLSNSRIKNVYIGARDLLNDAFCCLARLDNKIVGVALCEGVDKQVKIRAFNVKNPFRLNSKPFNFKEWNFLYAGHVSLFVKPENRGLGVAKELLNNLEIKYVDLFQLKSPDHLLFHALEDAIPFIVKNSLASLPLNVNLNSVNFNNSIHSLTEAIEHTKLGIDVKLFGENLSIKALEPNPKRSKLRM